MTKRDTMYFVMVRTELDSLYVTIPYPSSREAVGYTTKRDAMKVFKQAVKNIPVQGSKGKVLLIKAMLWPAQWVTDIADSLSWHGTPKNSCPYYEHVESKEF